MSEDSEHCHGIDRRTLSEVRGTQINIFYFKQVVDDESVKLCLLSP
jgi:hypothetical protein